MRILGIDTTTKFLCIVLYEDGRVYEYNLEVGRKLSAVICVTIKRILDSLKLKASSIDYFACGLGPGSFTGVRIGLATIKAMAWSLNKPIIGIPTLDILAKGARLKDGYIIPAIDAKRNLIYCSKYKVKNGNLKRVSAYMLIDIEEFLEKAKDNSVFLGDALNLYKDKLLGKIKGAIVLDKDNWYPKGHSIIELALEKIKAKEFDSVFKIKPIYLYPKECQIRK